MEIASEHLHSQKVGARELKFQEKVAKTKLTLKEPHLKAGARWPLSCTFSESGNSGALGLNNKKYK